MSANIIRVWRHDGEPDRIHYIIRRTGERRHLYEDRGSALYTFLEGML